MQSLDHAIRAALAAACRFIGVDLVFEQVIDAGEIAPHADRPRDGRRADLEHAFDFVEQLDGRSAFAVELVDESHDGRVAHAADLHQLDGALLDALRAVDDHERAVDGGQRAIGVFREIFVARRVEEIDDLPAERELHHRGRDGDSALLLDRHPVGRRVARGFAALDRAGELDGAAEQQQLFGERGLAGVGMRNDGKSSSFPYFSDT